MTLVLSEHLCVRLGQPKRAPRTNDWFRLEILAGASALPLSFTVVGVPVFCPWGVKFNNNLNFLERQGFEI